MFKKIILLLLLVSTTILHAMQNDQNDGQASSASKPNIKEKTISKKTLLAGDIPTTIKIATFVGNASLGRNEFFQQLEMFKKTLLSVSFPAEDAFAAMENIYTKTFYDDVIHFAALGHYAICSMQAVNKGSYIFVKIIIVAGRTGRIALVNKQAATLKDYYTESIAADLKRTCLNDFHQTVDELTLI